ncbi:MAG: hypothetical protein ACRC6V_19345 [Bacteroidales bacterium]
MHYVIDNIVSEEIPKLAWLVYLNSVDLYEMVVNDSSIGFYSFEDEDDYVEIHLYIFPSGRKHSMSAMRHIIRSQTKPIKTSVYGTHEYVFKIAQRLGFEHTDTCIDNITKNGVKYDVWDLIYKENNNG